jgi:hypothetical protein
MSIIKFGTNATAFPLAGTPEFNGATETIVIQRSETVTGDAVLAALKDADGFSIDSGTYQSGFKAPDSVAVGATTITVIMTKLSADQQTLKELQKANAQAQIAIGILESTTQYSVNNLGV